MPQKFLIASNGRAIMSGNNLVGILGEAPLKLDTPTNLVITNGVLSFDAVTHATGYKVLWNTTELGEATSTSFTLNDRVYYNVNGQIKVQAIDSTSTYEASEYGSCATLYPTVIAPLLASGSISGNTLTITYSSGTKDATAVSYMDGQGVYKYKKLYAATTTSVDLSNPEASIIDLPNGAYDIRLQTGVNGQALSNENESGIYTLNSIEGPSYDYYRDTTQLTTYAVTDCDHYEILNQLGDMVIDNIPASGSIYLNQQYYESTNNTLSIRGYSSNPAKTNSRLENMFVVYPLYETAQPTAGSVSGNTLTFGTSADAEVWKVFVSGFSNDNAVFECSASLGNIDLTTVSELTSLPAGSYYITYLGKCKGKANSPVSNCGNWTKQAEGESITYHTKSITVTGPSTRPKDSLGAYTNINMTMSDDTWETFFVYVDGNRLLPYDDESDGYVEIVNENLGAIIHNTSSIFENPIDEGNMDVYCNWDILFITPKGSEESYIYPANNSGAISHVQLNVEDVGATWTPAFVWDGSEGTVSNITKTYDEEEGYYFYYADFSNISGPMSVEVTDGGGGDETVTVVNTSGNFTLSGVPSVRSKTGNVYNDIVINYTASPNTQVPGITVTCGGSVQNSWFIDYAYSSGKSGTITIHGQVTIEESTESLDSGNMIITFNSLKKRTVELEATLPDKTSLEETLIMSTAKPVKVALCDDDEYSPSDWQAYNLRYCTVYIALDEFDSKWYTTITWNDESESSTTDNTLIEYEAPWETYTLTVTTVGGGEYSVETDTDGQVYDLSTGATDSSMQPECDCGEFITIDGLWYDGGAEEWLFDATLTDDDCISWSLPE